MRLGVLILPFCTVGLWYISMGMQNWCAFFDIGFLCSRMASFLLMLEVVSTVRPYDEEFVRVVL